MTENYRGASTGSTPAPTAWVDDVVAWTTRNWDWFDPSHSHLLFWPDRPYQPTMDILVAGCGPSQAAVIAHNNPQAHVTAIDIEEDVINQEIYLRHKHMLLNLDARALQPLPVEEVATLDKSFDLIIASGVLNEVDTPEVAMKALAGVLRPDGVIAIALPAKSGPDCPKAFTVDDCLDLVDGAGLAFQNWLHKEPYYPPLAGDGEYLATLRDLPERQMWAAMAQLRRPDRHLFTACRPQRRPENYRIDFSTPTAADYVPSGRHGVALDNAEPNCAYLVRTDSTFELEPVQLDMIQAVDGERSIRQIAENTGNGIGSAVSFFAQLWLMDLVAIAIPG